MKISKVYTRTGDKGMTSLVGGIRIDKSATRLDAYGTIDELSSHIGLLIAYIEQNLNDEHILEVNREYLQHDYYTDIITFDYCEDDVLNGDLVISLDTVRTNAELFHKDYDEELDRVNIHGILHLCGQNDKGPGEREQMEAAENKALALR